MVFQDYALFPHLNVLDNVSFGLGALPRGQRRARALEALSGVGMTESAAVHPHTLSGGQQQRVALARALAPQPAAMLLDEPFASLDRRLREQVRDDTLRVLKQSGAAVILVTHDPEEAMSMADRIAIMNQGRIEQTGTPEQIYLRPVNAFVAQFLGEANRFPGVVQNGVVSTALGPLPAHGLAHGSQVDVLIRPETLRLEPDRDRQGVPRAVVRAVRLIGANTVVDLELSQDSGVRRVRALQMGPPTVAPGDQVTLCPDPDRALVFAAQ